MKSIIAKIFLLTIYSSLAFSMEDLNNTNNKLQLNSSTSASAQSMPKKKSRKKKKNKKGSQKINTSAVASEESIKESLPINESNSFDISAENLPSLLINKDNALNMHDKKVYLQSIQKLLSILHLMKQLAPYIKSINKSNATLAEIPNYIRYFNSFKPLSELEKSEPVINKVEMDKMQQGEYYVGGLTTSEAIAAAIQSQEIWTRYKAYCEKTAENNSQIIDINSNKFEKHIRQIFTHNSPIALRKKIKQITHKLINSENLDLKIIGQWLLVKAESEKIVEIIDAIKIKLFKIIAIISPTIVSGNFVRQGSNGAIYSFDFDKVLAELKINDIFKNWLSDLASFLETYIKDLLESVSTLERIIHFVDYIYEKNRYLNSAENAYLINLTNKILNQFEKNKENYSKLYKLLLQEQKRIFKSVTKKQESLLRRAYGYDILAEDSVSFSPMLFESKQNENTASDNYVEHAEKFEETYQLRALAQEKKQKQQALEQRQKAPKTDIFEKENFIEITNDNITSENLLVSLNDEIEVNLSQYDDRCLCWFNPIYRENKRFDSLLYHSFPLGMDELIKRYGRRQNWPNRTHPGQLDTRYYIGGEIRYPDGHKQIVLFAITQDPQGIIYHRGFEVKDISLFDEFATNKFEFDFPKGFEEPEYEIKNIICNLNHPEKLTYKINPFCITLKDALNGVAITLFRSSFESQTEH